MAVKGSTKAERDEARTALRRRRRVEFFVKKMREARNGRAQLQQACYFAQAVADDELDDEGRRRLATAIAKVVEEAHR